VFRDGAKAHLASSPIVTSAQQASKKQQRRASKRDNDAFSREMAVVREAQKKRRRVRNRLIAALAIVVAAGLVAGGVGLVFWKRADDALAGPKNMRSDGILLAGTQQKVAAVTTAAIPPHGKPVATAASVRAPAGVLPLDLYVDYGQAGSAAFGAKNGALLAQWVAAGIATVEIHPVALNSAHHRYATRAANAIACVAASKPDSALTVSTALLTAASKKGFGYPDDDGIAALVKRAGVSSADVRSCITAETYDAWVTAATKRATTAPLPDTKVGRLTATPLILADGTRYTGKAGDSAAFDQFAATIGEPLEAAAQASSGAGADSGLGG
jgi:hypothetical protein